jgi:S1-C subfamily serine protease
MSQTVSGGPRGRETRLLLGTIVVSVIVLVVLARFRFPDESAREIAEPAPAPLERLAAQATFDELAAIMTDLERRLAPRLAVVPIVPERDSGPFAVAPRMTSDRAVAVLDPGERLESNSDPAARLIGRDPTRDLAVIAVPAVADGAVTPRTGTVRPGPRYVAVVEGSAQGPVIRPVYLARTDVMQDPRTNIPMFRVAALQQALPRGAALFTLAGAFIGVVSEGGSQATVMPAEAMIAAALSVQGDTEMRGDAAIDVQGLSPALSKATGASSGVVVSYVHPQGPAAGVVESGDVITALDEINVTTPGGFLRLIRSRPPGTAVALRLIRRGKPIDVSLTARDATGPPLPSVENSDPGMTLRSVQNLGAEVVAVRPGGAAARAGITVGDIIVRLNGRNDPTSADVMRAYRDADAGAAQLLTVQRGTQHIVTALEKP